MSRKQDKVTREVNRILSAATMPFVQELERKREQAKRKARAEVNRRLRNRDAISEQKPAKPLAGQMSLFDECGE